MQNSLWKLTALAGVVGIGFLAVLQAQRGLNTPTDVDPNAPVAEAGAEKGGDVDRRPSETLEGLGEFDPVASPLNRGTRHGETPRPRSTRDDRLATRDDTSAQNEPPEAADDEFDSVPSRKPRIGGMSRSFDEGEPVARREPNARAVGLDFREEMQPIPPKSTPSDSDSDDPFGSSGSKSKIVPVGGKSSTAPPEFDDEPGRGRVTQAGNEEPAPAFEPLPEPANREGDRREPARRASEPPRELTAPGPKLLLGPTPDDTPRSGSPSFEGDDLPSQPKGRGQVTPAGLKDADTSDAGPAVGDFSREAKPIRGEDPFGDDDPGPTPEARPTPRRTTTPPGRATEDRSADALPRLEGPSRGAPPEASERSFDPKEEPTPAPKSRGGLGDIPADGGFGDEPPAAPRSKELEPIPSAEPPLGSNSARERPEATPDLSTDRDFPATRRAAEPSEEFPPLPEPKPRDTAPRSTPPRGTTPRSTTPRNTLPPLEDEGPRGDTRTDPLDAPRTEPTRDAEPPREAEPRRDEPKSEDPLDALLRRNKSSRDVPARDERPRGDRIRDDRTLEDRPRDDRSDPLPRSVPGADSARPTNDRGDFLGDGVVSSTTPKGPQRPQLKIEKQAPPNAVIGQPLVYNIIIKNLGETAAHDVVVEDRIPKGTELSGTIPRAELVDKTLVWKLGAMQPGEEKKIAVRVTPISEGQIGSVATVNFVAEVGAKTMITAPRLQLDVTAPPQVRMGEAVPFVFRLKNAGSADAKGVIIRNIVPEGLRHQDGNDLEYELGTLGAGQSREVKLTLTAVKPGPSTNRVIATADGNVNEEKSARVDVVGPALSVARLGPKKCYLGRQVTYTTTVSNDSDRTSDGATVVEVVPAGFEYVDSNPAGNYSPENRTLSWRIDRMRAGENVNLKVRFQAKTAGVKSMKVRAIEGGAASSEVVAETEVVGAASLESQVTTGGGPLGVGDKATFRILVRNRGNDGAGNVRLKLTLPEEVEFVSSDARWTVSQDGREVTFASIARLEAGRDSSLQVVLKATRAGDARLTLNTEADDMRPIAKEEQVVILADEESSVLSPPRR